MGDTIIVAIITVVGTIANTLISKKTNKKIENINDINNKLDFMRKESKEDMLKHTVDADKTYLINFLSDLENGVPKTEVQIKRTYEIYERYVNNGGNSYVHDKWEEVKKLGLL
ncbi:MAG: hypothetical protein U0O41_08390 [Clostridia bacterium]|jgi:hypothetical protein|nr:MAG TPA: peptidase [Caudoviricetes sp.]DAY62723.1 MAG TPA: peptidase [Caudoviricetes sp.]